MSILSFPAIRESHLSPFIQTSPKRDVFDCREED